MCNQASIMPARKLLEFEFAVTGVMRLALTFKSKKELLEQLFLVDAASKYRDLSSETKITNEWESVVLAIAPSTTLALVGVEPMVVAYVRESWDESSGQTFVWSLPTETFNSIRLGEHGDVVDGGEPLRDIETFFRAVDGCSTYEGSPDLDSSQFFIIRLARPEKLKVAGGKHVEARTSKSIAELLQVETGTQLAWKTGVNVIGNSIRVYDEQPDKSGTPMSNKSCFTRVITFQKNQFV